MNLPQHVANNIINYINDVFDKYMNQLLHQGRIDTYNAQLLLPKMKVAGSSDVFNQLVSYYRNSPEIPYSAINSAVVNYASNYLNSALNRNQPQASFTSGGGISISGDNIQPVFGQTPGTANITIGDTTSQPVDVSEKQGAPVGIIASQFGTVSTECPFVCNEDSNATSYSTAYESHPIVDVTTRYVIKDTLDSNKSYSYFRCVSHIPETCVEVMINNLVRSNPKLCGSGKWIADIDYHQFILEEMAAPFVTTPVDLSMLDDSKAEGLSVDARISSVLDSIGMLNFNVVSVISKIIVKEFNIKLKQYVRLTSNIGSILAIENINDLRTLASLRIPNCAQTYHGNYEKAILHCFKSVIKGIFTDKTPNGSYAVGDIAPHLLSSPRFVIRDNGRCERFMAFDDNDFISAVSNLYTAFANNRNIVVTNFIPDKFDEAIANKIIFTKTGHSNIFEYLMKHIFGTVPKTVLMVEGDKRLCVRVGVTLDSEIFVYEDTSFDKSYGIKGVDGK